MSSVRIAGKRDGMPSFTGCDFSHASMRRCNVDHALFVGCDFSDVKWNGGTFVGCELRRCILDLAHLEEAGVYMDKTRHV